MPKTEKHHVFDPPAKPADDAFLSRVPTEVADAAIRGTDLRGIADSRRIIRAAHAAKRARAADITAMRRRHKAETAEAEHKIAEATRQAAALATAHAAQIARASRDFDNMQAKAEAAKVQFAKCKMVLRQYRDPEPYRRAAARRRADAMAARVLEEELAATLDKVSPADTVYDFVAAGGTTPAKEALIAHYATATTDDDATGADDPTQQLARSLPLSARTAAAHLARSIDATELFDEHVLPIEDQLGHHDGRRDPVTPLNWRDREHLYDLLSYLPERARNAAVNRIAKGIPDSAPNPLYDPDVPDYGHRATYLHATRQWGAAPPVARKVAEHGADPKRRALAATASQEIRRDLMTRWGQYDGTRLIDNMST